MTKKEERVLEIIQEHFLDVGIPLEGRLEKAVVLALKDAIRDYSVYGSPEDVLKFNDFIRQNAPHFNIELRG